MKPIVVRNWTAWIGLVFSLPLIGLAFWDINTDSQKWSAWAVMAIGVFCFVLFFFQVNHTDTFSEEGITIDGLLGKKTYLWSDVIQVKTYWTARTTRGGRTHRIRHLGFTFKGGQPMGAVDDPYPWMLKNFRTCVGVEYRADLEELVLRCYGPLDDKVFWSLSKK